MLGSIRLTQKQISTTKDSQKISNAVSKEQKWTIFIIMCSLLLFFIGCTSPEAQLKALVKKESFREAAKFYDLHIDYFKQDRSVNLKYLTTIADKLNSSSDKNAKSLIQKLIDVNCPAEESQWSYIKRVLCQTQKLLAEYNNYELLKNKEFRSSTINKLEVVSKHKTNRIKETAVDSFSRFDHCAGKNFFEVYPITLEPSSFLTNNFDDVLHILSSLNTRKIECFVRTYKLVETLRRDQFCNISNLYISVYMKEKSIERQPNFGIVLECLQDAKKLGFRPSKVPGLKIGFIKVRSARLHENNLVEFPIKIESNLPFEFVNIDSNDLSLKNVADSFDYSIIFHVLESVCKRQFIDRKKISSRFLSGTVPVPNPYYETFRLKANQSQAELRNALNQLNFCRGIWCLALAQTVRSKRNSHNYIMRQLQSTPSTIEKPVYKGYEFNSIKINSQKIIRAESYVINNINKTHSANDLSFSKERDFTIFYGLHDKDPKRNEYLQGVSSESELEKWEQKDIIFDVLNIAKYLKTYDFKMKKKLSFDAVQNEMLRRENSLIEKSQASEPTIIDPRFECVVLVRNPKGKFGAGFFVTSAVFLTNYHVVEGVKYIEMTTYNGEDTFGKVIHYDIRLDLALVKTQTRGAPVKFFEKTQLMPGLNVEAIGHPEGLEFSITSGIISAVREIPSKYAPDADEVLFIQTDTPVNPGNSGGPLYLGNKVVGVNTLKVAKTETEGLGFAVHYSELIRFLGENLEDYHE